MPPRPPREILLKRWPSVMPENRELSDFWKSKSLQSKREREREGRENDIARLDEIYIVREGGAHYAL